MDEIIIKHALDHAGGVASQYSDIIRVISPRSAHTSVAQLNMARYGDVLDENPPRVKLRVDRNVVAEVLSKVLAHHDIEDVTVEDPPLEEVIAEMFELSQQQAEKEPAGMN